MSTHVKVLLAIVLISFCYSEVKIAAPAQNDALLEQQNFLDKNLLMDPIMHKDSKTIFKAWHYVFNKTYDLDSEEGLKKLKTFQDNLKMINEHNANPNKSYTMGLNHLSDMNEEEVKAYYNIKPFKFDEVVKSLRGLGNVNIDDESEEKVELKSAGFPITNWQSYMLSVRNQQTCGSCWAFTTQAVNEGCFNKWNSRLQAFFSVQELVDCDTTNHGCKGGWFDGAFNFFKTHTIIYDNSYPYKNVQQSCQYTKGMSGDTNLYVTGYDWYQQGRKDISAYYNMLKKGPVAVAVDANNAWFKYKGGVFNSPCSTAVNHAVTAVGYQCASSCYFIIKNSWGPTWGEYGYIKIQHSNYYDACNIVKNAYQPFGFRN